MKELYCMCSLHTMNTRSVLWILSTGAIPIAANSASPMFFTSMAFPLPCIPENPTGILVLPHFAGSATPYMDSGSKGAIIGLTIEHTSADIYKALMEGVSYEMLLNIKMLHKAGVKIRRLRATGGAKSSGQIDS